MKSETSTSEGRRVPRLLLTASDVREAVRSLRNERHFVIDVETSDERAASNTLLWVGLGASACSYLIPVGHTKGVLLKPERREQVAACLEYPNGDPRGLTKKGNISWRMVDVLRNAEYGPPPHQLYPNQVCELIEPLLWSECAKIGHNLKFDLLSLAKYYDDAVPPGPYHDTIVLRHVLDEDLESYKLKDLVCSWFGIDWRKRPQFYPNLGEQGVLNFGIDEAARYLNKDLRYTWMMFKRWYPLLAKQDVLDTYRFEMSGYPVIMAMEQTGFPVDMTKRGAVREKLMGQITTIEQQVFDIAGGEFDLSSTEAKRWVLFGKYSREVAPVFPHHSKAKALLTQELPVKSKTVKTSVAQVTQGVLEQLHNDGSEVAGLFLEWSTLDKLRGTFIDGVDKYLVHRNGMTTIHTGFKIHGTATGRFSCAQPNIQQLPRGSVIRDLFVGGEGHYIIVADYDQIELRCLAYAANEPTMSRIFREGRDIHAEAAATMYRVPVEQVTGDIRQVGKTANFATSYGAGPERVAAVAGVSKRRGQQFLDRYYEEFSALQPWKTTILNQARQRGDRTAPLTRPPYVIIPPNGRRRRLPDLFHPDDWRVWRAERQAVNAYIQGFAANITKMAMREIYTKLKPYPAQIIAQVHDEVVLRVEEHAAPEVLSEVRRVMSGVTDADGEPILGEIPLVVSAACGPSWAAAKG